MVSALPIVFTAFFDLKIWGDQATRNTGKIWSERCKSMLDFMMSDHASEGSTPLIAMTRGRACRHGNAPQTIFVRFGDRRRSVDRGDINSRRRFEKKTLWLLARTVCKARKVFEHSSRKRRPKICTAAVFCVRDGWENSDNIF